MIRGIGLDLVDLDRIERLEERYGDRFAEKLYTETERKQFPTKNPVPRMAALFAAKEAAVKALGTGFADGIGFHSVEVEHMPSGKPEIRFLDQGLVKCEELGVKSAYVSLTHTDKSASAVVILEG